MSEAAESPDFDSLVRLESIKATTWLLDHSDQDVFDLEDVLNIAMGIEDYVQGGGTVNVQCQDKRFVR